MKVKVYRSDEANLRLRQEGTFSMPYINTDINESYEHGNVAERYAHDILGCFAHGVHYYCDWNLTLNEKNEPCHNRTGRGCSADAPVYCNKETGKLVFRLSYYCIGHISKFVQKGAKVVCYSSYTEKLECCAFKNPDRTVALVVLNKTGEDLPAYIRLSGCVYKTKIPRRSIATFIIEKE